MAWWIRDDFCPEIQVRSACSATSEMLPVFERGSGGRHPQASGSDKAFVDPSPIGVAIMIVAIGWHTDDGVMWKISPSDAVNFHLWTVITTLPVP
jgi:hypothetical protein